MNLILFTPQETGPLLPRQDPRAQHILKVLRRQPGDSFDAGLIDGPRGKGTLTGIDEAGLHLCFAWGEAPPPLSPVSLLVGLPRPQTVRKILLEATTLGVEAIHFFTSARGEPGYAQSTLWSSGEWRRIAISGAEQAFCTRLPVITWEQSLQDEIARIPADCMRLALDNYESPSALGQVAVRDGKIVLALGSERGWSKDERVLLANHAFSFVHLGPRVLRTETAAVAAVSIVLSKLGRA
ncbi:MAG: RsmE family RNA methyltransferase [Opitutaceae bacterium]|jgi:RsmE family RNA methyltransferase